MPSAPKEMAAMLTKAAARARLVTTGSGSSGSAARDSTRIKAVSSPVAAARDPITIPLPQPWLPASPKARTTAAMPAEPSSAPPASRRCGRPALGLGSTATAPATASAAMGALTYRHQRQPANWVRTPPRIRPIAAPDMAAVLKILNAAARSRASVKVTVSSASVVGASRPANTPWTARAPMSIPESTAAPPAADAVANPIAPMIRASRLPMMSPTRPPNSSDAPNASV
ncbi:MAG TPA: hypothetical protein VN969_34035 [Streptosporangiaceae bacterium]|nr:hypothetical protein [Streptosporangiaceae bacterium]